jgi:hypothetical protein
MRKTQAFCLALVAICALSSMIANSASAEATLLAEWLIGGAGVTTLTSVTQTVVQLLLTDLRNPATAVCSSVVYDGSVGANGEFEVTEVLTLAGVAITLSAMMKCEGTGACETSSAEFAPEGLPWHGLIFLDAVTGLFLTVYFKSAYSVTCKILGIKTTDECTATEDGDEIVNTIEGAEFKEGEELLPDGNCTIGGSGEGTIIYTVNVIQTLTLQPVLVSSV